MTIRPSTDADLPAIREIQAAAREASQWNPSDYSVRVAEVDKAVVGFIVVRPIVDGEWEILNLAVTPQARRKGVGRQLLSDAIARCRGSIFLEVRASNQVARNFYEHLGFEVVTTRPRYYSDPEESALVMRLHSC